MEKFEQEVCWTLSREDIDDILERNGESLSEEEYYDVARTFKRAVETWCDDWDNYLEDFIKDVIKERSKND